MPVKNLRVAVVPLDIRKDDKLYNLSQAERRLAALEPGVDLVVLPELFTTGFTPDAEVLGQLAETNTGETMSHVATWARKYGFAICGSFVARTATKLYNRGFMIEPSGDETFYDKRHLFSAGGENRVLTPGRGKSPVVRYRGWNIKLAICYDLRFPVWLRNRNLEYDALVIPANWPEKRGFAWRQLLVARAIENQCYVIGANREGHDVYGDYPPGLVHVFDHWGREVSDRRDDGIVYVTLDASQLTTDRNRFAPWRDADSFEVNVD